MPGGQLTAVGLNNPLRQGSVPYDDGTKDYFGPNGAITEDASGVGTQTAGLEFGDALLSRSVVTPASIDYGTAAAGVANFSLGLYKTTIGSIDILAGGVLPASLPFPASLVAGPVVGTAAEAVGVYQITTGVARESRAVRQFHQVLTTPSPDTSVQANLSRFISGVGPFGLPRAPTIEDILGNLP